MEQAIKALIDRFSGDQNPLCKREDKVDAVNERPLPEDAILVEAWPPLNPRRLESRTPIDDFDINPRLIKSIDAVEPSAPITDDFEIIVKSKVDPNTPGF